MSETELGYKQTKIGKLPNDWEVSKLSDVCEIKGGKRLPKGYELQEHKNNIPYIRVADMYMGGICLDNIKYVPAEIADKIKNYKISSKDLFISVAGTLGIVGEVPEELDGANLTENADKLCNIKIDKKYLLNVLQSEVIQTIILSEMTNNAQPKLALTRIKEFLIPIPSIEEQEKIAEILSTWDSAIEKQEQLIEKKKEFKKGLMQNLYSKGTKKEMLVKSKLGEVPESWKIVKAKEVFKSVSIKDNENEELLSVTQDKGTILRSQLEGNVVMPEGSTRGYKLVVPNNFIISLSSFQGGLEISKHRGIISPAYTVLDNKIEICHDYFKYYFKKEEFISRLNGAIVGIRDGKQISYADFGEMFLPVPSLEEQIKIAEILIVADKEIELLEKELEVLKLQKKGLMQRLLTGEVRVKV